jgi:hypothetical protein
MGNLCGTDRDRGYDHDAVLRADTDFKVSVCEWQTVRDCRCWNVPRAVSQSFRASRTLAL